MKDVLNTKEIEQLYKIPSQRILNYRREGKLKANKVGKEWLFNKNEIERFLGIENNSEILELRLKVKELELENKALALKLKSITHLIDTASLLIK